jgi:hypothetical protein
VNTALALRHRRHGAVHCARRVASSRSSPHNVDRCADECGRRELFGSWLTLAHSAAVQQQCARVPFQFGLHSGSIRRGSHPCRRSSLTVLRSNRRPGLAQFSSGGVVLGAPSLKCLGLNLCCTAANVAATLAASMALPADTDHDSGEARFARAITHWARNGPLAMALRT